MAKKEKQDIKEIEMTDQEKKAFAEIVMGSEGQKIKYFKKQIRSNIIGSIITTALTLGVSWWFGINIAFVAPFALIFIGSSCALTCIASKAGIKRILKNASNGKINYKQYKQLLKSGELDNWMKLEGKATLETAETTNHTGKGQKTQSAVAEIDGISLSAEELAVLQKLMGKKVVDVVIKAKVEQPTEPKQPIDDGRDA